MSYEWDPAKARANFAKHGIYFADAGAALEDERALTIQDIISSEEERLVTLGMDAMGRILVVVYQWRGSNARIISARQASRRERRQYEEGHEA